MTDWEFFVETSRLEIILIDGVYYARGDRVRLQPRSGAADIFDLALVGQIATIEAIEQDLENRIYFAVVLDDDPVRDLGMLRQPGHRFFSPEEVEPLPKDRHDHK